MSTGRFAEDADAIGIEIVVGGMSPQNGRVTPDELPVHRGDLEDLIQRRQVVHLWLEGIERLGFVEGVPCCAWEMDNADVIPILRQHHEIETNPGVRETLGELLRRH